MIWPADPRAQAVAAELWSSIARRPLVSVHNGLPARYLAEDLPLTDPVNLLVSHDQGVQALLRAHDLRAEFSATDGWRTESSRRAFALLWDHMVAVRSQPWMVDGGDDLAPGAGLPPFRPGQPAEAVYDQLAARMAREPIYPRRLLAAAELARFATSDDPADDLLAHDVLAEDEVWAGRVVPTFSPDRYLDPDRRGWRTDSDLLAEVTAIDTEELDGFLQALRRRRAFFLDHGATMAEYHSSDTSVARLPARDAAELYRLARSGELLPGEALALRGHLLWEMGAMSADDGLVMALYPPAGFHAADRPSTEDRGVATRTATLLTDFGAHPGFRVWLFSIDATAYLDEVVPLAVNHACLTAVPPTRFADDPDRLREIRRIAVGSLGAGRVLGVVDDMSGPFAIPSRHALARRLDAGALAELVVDGQLDEDRAYADLSAALDRSILGSPAVQAT